MREAERSLSPPGDPPPETAPSATPAVTAATPTAPAATPTTAAAPRLPRILCVDDEPAVLKVLTRALEHDFEIVTANDPMKALVLLEHGMDFSVVISDMRMPQMDGAEFLARVRRLAPQSTRLALTACLERELSADEVFGILTKPCPINLLHASVRAAVEHHVLGALLARSAPALVPEPRRIGHEPLGSAETEFEPSLPGLISAQRPLDRSANQLPHLSELEFDPWHVARAIGTTTATTATTATAATAATTAARTAATAGAAAAAAADPEAPRLSMLAGVAEKFFRLGHTREAERILRPALWDFLQRCEAERRCIERGLQREGERLTEREVDLAGRLALRLAADTSAAQWIDYLFRVFSAASRPLPPEMIEQLHDVLRHTPGVNRGLFLRYLSVLRACRQEFGPSEHFLIRRIEGLEPLICQ